MSNPDDLAARVESLASEVRVAIAARAELTATEAALRAMVMALPESMCRVVAQAMLDRPEGDTLEQATAPVAPAVREAAAPDPIELGEPQRLVRPPGHSTADLDGVDEFPALRDAKPSKPFVPHVASEPRRVVSGKDWSNDERFT